MWHEHVLELPAALGEERLVAGEVGKGRELDEVGHGVVVLRGGFLAAVLARGHPGAEVGEPLLHAGDRRLRQGALLSEHLHGPGDLGEVQPVDNARWTTGRDAGHRLGVVEIRVHAGGGIEEERPQEFVGFGGVASVAGHESGSGEGRDAVPQRVHRLAVGKKVVWVRFPVAADVGQAVGLRGIGPPVVAVGIEVVRGALGMRSTVGRDRERRQCQGGVRRLKNPLAVEAGDVDPHGR